MTPLIAEFVKHAPDAETLQWFDVGRFPEHVTLEINDDILNLPYPRTAVVGLDCEGSKFMLVMFGEGKSVSVSGFSLTPAPQFIEPFTYLYAENEMRIFGDKGKKPDPKIYKPVMAMIAMFLKGLDKHTTAYVPTVRKSFINQKRLAQGKPPVLFDWRTVIIDPPAQKTEHKGGTHASPRLHDRRGHWRTTKTGKRSWVKACKSRRPKQRNCL